MPCWTNRPQDPTLQGPAQTSLAHIHNHFMLQTEHQFRPARIGNRSVHLSKHQVGKTPMQNSASDLAVKGMLTDPGDHFKGRFEVERKFRVDDITPLLHRLEQLAAVPFTLGNSETDVFLDLSDGRLEANNQFQTLRQMLPSGRVLWISKGPQKDECIAMDLPDFEKALSMLRSLGFEEKRKIHKKARYLFRRPISCHSGFCRRAWLLRGTGCDDRRQKRSADTS